MCRCQEFSAPKQTYLLIAFFMNFLKCPHTYATPVKVNGKMFHLSTAHSQSHLCPKRNQDQAQQNTAWSNTWSQTLVWQSNRITNSGLKKKWETSKTGLSNELAHLFPPSKWKCNQNGPWQRLPKVYPRKDVRNPASWRGRVTAGHLLWLPMLTHKMATLLLRHHGSEKFDLSDRTWLS